jgi:hypothetical protein
VRQRVDGSVTFSGEAIRLPIQIAALHGKSRNHPDSICRSHSKTAITRHCGSRRRQLPLPGVLPRPRKLTPEQETALAAHIAAHPDVTLAALQTWLAAEHAVWLSNGAIWSAVDRLGLSFKKRHSTPPSGTARMSPRGAGSGAQRSPSSMPTSSSSSTRPAPAPR